MQVTRFFIATLALTAAAWAHAGKAERDFYAKETEPAVKKASETLKKSCGCDVKFDVKVDTFETVDHLRKVNHMVSSISDKAPTYCNDGPSKAAICKMKTLELARTKETTITYANGKMVLTTEGESTYGWDHMVEKLDK
jgi:hypothetical protein